MDLALYKRLIRLVEKSEISELSIEEGDLKIKIVKNNPQVSHVSQPVVHRAEHTIPANEQPNVSSAPNSGQIQPEAVNNNLSEIKSPIVGTFYRAPSPDSAPFVNVGDTIKEGSILCIVEAMKLMNEIESEVSGKIVQILVENGTPVEYNQPLFLVEKN
jgi:acetyl-CoA carboxylase biotin carboxyl carrier protein